MAQPVAKVRSRKDGSAVPLDELDRKLLNLLQGSFPIAARPYAHVAQLAGFPEEEVLARTKRLLDERIIREITPIFDTRVLGYSSMLVAARVDSANPWRAAKIINSHPGVSHNYLRDHDFNLWFTIATEPDSPLGLEGTLEVLERLTGAESVRQLPTLRLFKIRMDLEMEKGTETLAAAAAEALDYEEPEAIELSELDYAVIRATQGPMEVIPEPFAPPATQLGITQEALFEHLESMRERRALRRVAAILFHRRAGFSANGMGVWRVPEERILELGPAHGLVPGHLALLPAADVRGLALLGLHDGARALQGGVRRDPRLDRRGHRHRGPPHALLLDGVQEGPPALLHGRAQAVGSGARVAAEQRSAAAYARAVQLLPGGVNSPVRAMRSIGRDPIFVSRGEGAELVDVDGNRYVDWVMSWGPLIAGHAHPEVVEAVSAAAAAGTSFGAPTEAEVELAAEVVERVPSAEMVRMTSSGTEASMSAIRLARAATGRDTIVKFAGAYHGHVDGLLADAGSGLATQGIPASPGVTAAQAADTVVVPWNAPLAGARGGGRHLRAIPGQHGARPARDGFLQQLRDYADCDRSAAHLRRGDHRLPRGPRRRAGARGRHARPDRARQGHRRRPAGRGVRRAARPHGADRAGRRRLPGGHAVGQPARHRRRARDAAAARRRRLRGARSPHAGPGGGPRGGGTGGRRGRVGRLDHGPPDALLRRAPPRNYDQARACDLDAHAAFCRGMLDRGVYLPPSQFEAWFPSLAHGDEHVERTLAPPARSSPSCERARSDGSSPPPTRRSPLRRGRAGARALRDARGMRGFVLEAVYEGYLMHYGEPRAFTGMDEDLRLLAGDALYALGLAAPGRGGDLEAVAALSDLISRSAQAHAEGRPGTPRRSGSRVRSALRASPPGSPR